MYVYNIINITLYIFEISASIRNAASNDLFYIIIISDFKFNIQLYLIYCIYIKK